MGGCGLKQLPAQLGALGALGLRDLRAGNNWQLGSGGDGAFAPLAQLAGLRRLSVRACGLARMPPQLADLAESLQDLDLSCCESLGSCAAGGEAAFAPLAALAGLTRLRLRRVSWGLEAIPAQVCTFVGGCIRANMHACVCVGGT